MGLDSRLRGVNRERDRQRLENDIALVDIVGLDSRLRSDFFLFFSRVGRPLSLFAAALFTHYGNAVHARFIRLTATLLRKNI